MVAGRAAATTAALLLLVVLCSAEEAAVKFGYSGADGPERWGTLSPAFSLCSSGKHQSPIDLPSFKSAVHDAKLAPLVMNYAAAVPSTLVGNSVSVALQFNGDAGAGKAAIDGKNYTLRQVHWHQPSEHTIDGERFPVELHMVHRSDGGDIAVVAVLYRLGGGGGGDPFVAQLDHELARLASDMAGGEEAASARVDAGEVETRPLRRSTTGRKYLRYSGSFTTPPCTENVVWHVVGKVREMSATQAAALRAPLPERNKKNARPTQLLNGRTVWLYEEEDHVHAMAPKLVD